MHNLHIAIITAGISTSVILAVLYYWAQDRLLQKESAAALGVGMLLGFAAIGAQSTDYYIFSISLAAYVAYFYHLKNNAEFNAKNESTMVSLFMGFVIGFSSLLGCSVCV